MEMPACEYIGIEALCHSLGCEQAEESLMSFLHRLAVDRPHAVFEISIAVESPDLAASAIRNMRNTTDDGRHADENCRAKEDKMVALTKAVTASYDKGKQTKDLFDWEAVADEYVWSHKQDWHDKVGAHVSSVHQLTDRT